MKYVIIGGRKCGTTSLEVFLNMQGFDVVRREQLFTKNDGFKLYNQEFSEFTPIVILRNPVDRAYSDWKYATQKKRSECFDKKRPLRYREYCLKENYNPGLGELNPLVQSKYSKWFMNWDIKIQIMNLEDMKKVKGFPKLNTTEGEISKEDRKWTQDKLNEM